MFFKPRPPKCGNADTCPCLTTYRKETEEIDAILWRRAGIDWRFLDLLDELGWYSPEDEDRFQEILTHMLLDDLVERRPDDPPIPDCVPIENRRMYELWGSPIGLTEKSLFIRLHLRWMRFCDRMERRSVRHTA